MRRRRRGRRGDRRRHRHRHRHAIEKYGHSLYACVMDSYDYDHALDVVQTPVPLAGLQYCFAVPTWY
eukprot:3267144-Rhodomonas_salina.1